MSIKPTAGYYRPDIDGLRAIAVILVILFHAGSEFVISGFIGVDLFFVISGYLLTGIILTQIRDQRFSVVDFFNRRLWRIQPALIVVSLAALVTASLLYVLPDYIGFLKSAKYNSLFLSNQFFAEQSISYASPQSEYFPLLHTWSLSIEWQWYLFLPFIILAGAYVSRRKGLNEGDKSKRGVLTLALWGSGTVALAIIALFISHKASDEAYYFLSTRAFEFTAGGSAFVLQRQIRAFRPWLLSLLSVMSLAVILLIAFKKDVINGYPDLWTVIVVLCAATLLYAGYGKEKCVAGILGLKPLAFIGRVSYSLYLWHWPVFAFSRYYGISLTGLNLGLVIIVIIGLSLVCYFLIEVPLRRVRVSLKRSISVLVIFPVILFTALYSFGMKYDGFPKRLGGDYAQRETTLSQYVSLAGNREQCLGNYQDPNRCLLGDLNGTHAGLMIGDSNSNHFWGFVDVLSKAEHIKMSALSESSCLALPNIWQYDWWIYHNTVYTKCHESAERYYRLIKQNHYDYVVIGEVWEMYANGPHLINKRDDERSDGLSKERMRKALHDALNIIVASGAKPVFIKTIFAMPQDYQACITRQAIQRGDFSSSSCNALRPRSGEDRFVTDLFAQLKSTFPSLVIIDPKDVQCSNGECMSQIGAIPLYRDVGHLTDYASYQLGQMYLEKFGNPFSH